MANNHSPLEQLKSFLNELFQFDSQDLDFGVYKILHYKRKEIKNFIDHLLVDKVKEELKNYSYDLLYINDQAHIEGYQPIEEVFKNKMLP